MRHGTEFADPVLVPGPNLRSLHTDTEQVDGAATELVDGPCVDGPCVDGPCVDGL